MARLMAALSVIWLLLLYIWPGPDHGCFVRDLAFAILPMVRLMAALSMNWLIAACSMTRIIAAFSVTWLMLRYQ
jgi:hypothetical protein